jgi:hypothetical protein
LVTDRSGCARVTQNDKLVGTVRISRGAIDFAKSGRRFRLQWSQLGDLVKEHGREIKGKPISPGGAGSIREARLKSAAPARVKAGSTVSD